VESPGVQATLVGWIVLGYVVSGAIAWWRRPDSRFGPLMVAAGLGTNSPGEDPGTEPEVLEAVKVALDLGNDLNAVDKNGETAMHGAAYKHVPTVVRYLAEQGARIDVWNRPNSKGWTPLKITEGVQRGMNIVSSPVTAAAIREVMASKSATLQQ